MATFEQGRFNQTEPWAWRARMLYSEAFSLAAAEKRPTHNLDLPTTYEQLAFYFGD